MPNEDRFEMLAALAALKKKDSKAFNLLLSQLNVERWQEIQANAYGRVLATCQAKLGDVAEMSGGEVVRTLSTHDALCEMALDRNAKSEPGVGIDDDIKLVINGAPSLAEGFERASKALFARRA